MPFKDPKKKKAHYENYQKGYMKRYVEKNKDRLNEYQKKYKVRKRFDHVEELKMIIKSENLASEGTKGFDSTLVFLYIWTTGIFKSCAIAYRTGLSFECVNDIKSNWIKCGLWSESDKCFYLEETKTDLEWILQIALVSLVGSGEVIAYQIAPNVSKEYEKQHEERSDSDSDVPF